MVIGKFAKWLCVLGAGVALSAIAAPEVTLSGVFGDKAVLTFPDGAVRTLKKGGAAVNGIRLLHTDSGRSARFDIDGEPVVLTLGAAPVQLASAETTPGLQELRLHPDPRGHINVDGAINDHKVRFIVDTGATLVAISADQAKRAGIDYTKGQRAVSHTANGRVATWTVMFASVRVGNIVLYNVEGAVLESGLSTPLLGMSALKRIEMQRDGNYYVLRKRY